MNGDQEDSLALELARWRGSIDERGQQNARSLEDMKKDISLVKDTQVEQGKELVALKTKVALGSALGGLLGAGIVTLALKGFG
jgi:hypothetical protein